VEVVIDTNVLVSGLIRPFGAPGEVAEMVLDGTVGAVCDDRVLHEYNHVLRRPQLRLDEPSVAAVLAAVVVNAKHALPVHSTIALPDEDDRCFYECALQADTGILVTGNRRHFPADTCSAIRVLSPAEFLEWLGKR
jgi:putative PIN family toxin of toxin-antitoxin system